MAKHCETNIFLPVSPVGPLQMDKKYPTRSGMSPGSWQHRMKLQLFLKASKAYYVLSDAATNLLKYGRALRYIKLSLQSYGKVILLLHGKMSGFKSFLSVSSQCWVCAGEQEQPRGDATISLYLK